MTILALDASSLFVPAHEATTAKREKTAFPQKRLKSWGASLQDTLRTVVTEEAHTKVVVKSEPTDEELLSAICRGEESALEVLYERYHRYAYALACRILRDPLASEDIVQDAFLSIWRKASSYQAQHGSVQSWVQAIVRHRAIDKIRASAHRNYQWTPLQAEHEQDPPSEQPDVWEQAWQSEQHRIIHEVMVQIPSEQREVIELAYFGGLTHAEISQQRQIPLGTVKGRMRLGLQKMKALLAERGLGVI
ncbi:MAG TPA: sigma-70 family RNA polymerase sigma factor [Ktedonobacteraceae bacterium]|nr:sigma-70 family RNA polymerase sigma factor [Ktedonobacteraceae bacterium]